MAGFTLLELVITVMLLATVGGLGGSVVKVVYDTFFTVNTLQELNSRGRYAMERMAREFRGASRTGITASSANPFNFTDQDGNAVSYTRSGNNLTRNGVTLATGVTSLTFTRNVTPAVSIRITMTMTTTVASGNQSITLVTTLYPRNI